MVQVFYFNILRIVSSGLMSIEARGCGEKFFGGLVRVE
jgi:hypothetical protein